MAWVPSGAFIFGVFAALVQLGLGGALLLRNARNQRAAVLGTLFIANGTITGIWAFLTGVPGLYEQLGVSGVRAAGALAQFAANLDMSTNVLILLLAFLYPRQGLGRIGAWWPLLVAAALLAPVGLSIYFDMAAAMTRSASVERTWMIFAVAFLPFEIPFIVLMLRWSKQWTAPQTPMLREQFALVFAAFGIRAAHLLTLMPLHFLDKIRQGAAFTSGSLFGFAALYAAMPIVLAISIARLVGQRGQQSPWLRRRTDFVLLFLGIGVVEGIINGSILFAGEFLWWQSLTVRIDVLVVRPILIWIAITRTGLIDLHGRRDVLASIGASLLVGGATMAGVYDIVAPGNNTIAWSVAGLAGAGACAATALLMRSRARPVLDQGETDLAGYAAAVDEAYRSGEPAPWQRARLTWLRERLHVSRAEHDAMVAGINTLRSAPEWRPGTMVLGRYRLDADLGGGQSETWRAYDVLDGVAVVLKMARIHDRDAMEREYEILRRLDHPNIVRVLRLERLMNAPVLVLAWCDAGSAAHKHLDTKGAQRLLDDVLRGLAAAHRKGIVHGDLKPSNILRDGAHYRVADFGSGRIRPKGLGWSHVTSQALGTPHFMAPELRDGGSPSPRSDLFAAALLVLDSLGLHPINATDGAVVQALARVKDPHLRATLSTCLAMAPEARPADATQVRVAPAAAYASR